MTDEPLNSLDSGGLFPRLQQRYGLRSNPLEMETPFFPDAMRQHALESLRHLCGFGDLALLLTGAPGAGKTRLLAELVRSESSRLDFHRVPSAALTSAQALARYLGALARTAIGEPASARDAVYRFFRWTEAQARKGRRQVLLIDDGDRAPAEILRLILAAFLAAEKGSAAVPVFSGTDELVKALGVDESSANVHQIHLPPLTEKDVFAFLEPRVHQAGGKASQLLSAGKVSRIRDLGQGTFSGVKRVTPSVWLDMVPWHAGAKVTTPLSLLSKSKWPVVALVLLGLSWMFVARQYDSSMANEDRAVVVSEPVRKSVTVGPEAISEAVADDDEVPEVRSEADVIAAAPDERGALDVESKELTLTEPEPEPEPEPVPTDMVQLFTPAMPARFKPIAQIRGEDGWTIQLIAGKLEMTALDVLEDNPQLSELVYTRGERKGQDWFMVFYGLFPTKAAADEAVSGLPDKIRKRGVWVRSTAGL